jgi:hypothetical protein
MFFRLLSSIGLGNFVILGNFIIIFSILLNATGADPGNSERGGRDSFGKNPYTDMWKVYEI